MGRDQCGKFDFTLAGLGKFMITIALTKEEITVTLALMQAGTRSMQGDQFDQASASYLYLRNKCAEAVIASESPAAPKLVDDAA